MNDHPLNRIYIFNSGGSLVHQRKRAYHLGSKESFSLIEKSFKAGSKRKRQQCRELYIFLPSLHCFCVCIVLFAPAKFVKVSIPGADMETHHGLLSLLLLVFPFSCVLVSCHVFSYIGLCFCVW